MRTIVRKYGGSSVATAEKVQSIARKIVESRKPGQSEVVVVSAMGKTTDQLLDLVNQVSPAPPARELDLLLSAGEQVSSSLMAMAVREAGADAIALTGRQSGIMTTPGHGSARVRDVATERIRSELEAGRVVIVAGFQGACPEGEITTLGRGGSDTTAVALAAALGADECQINTDVDGIYSADPRIVPGARRLPAVDYEEMKALALHGAQVLHVEAVELAQRHNVPVRVLDSFSPGEGTIVGSQLRDDSLPESRFSGISGIAGRKDLLDLTGAGGGLEEELNEYLTSSFCSPHDIVRLDGNGDSLAFRLLVSAENLADEETFSEELGERFPDLTIAHERGSVSAIGRALTEEPGLRREVRQALKAKEEGRYGSPVSESWILETAGVDLAARALHERFVEQPYSSGVA